MSTLNVVIQMTLISLVSTQQQFANNAERWSFIVTPMYNLLSPLSIPGQVPSLPVVRRDDYTYTQGIGSHKFHTRQRTWNEARRTCVAEGGHLAVINSIAESTVVKNLFDQAVASVGASLNSNWAFIGFHDLFEEGEYVTIHDQLLETAGYDEWTIGQPDNYNNSEDCGTVDRQGKLCDRPCNEAHGFICELPSY